MSARGDVRRRIVDGGVVAVLRGVDRERIVPAARAIADGGVTGIEVTADDPGATEKIAAIDRELEDHEAVFGAGTVLDAATASAAIDAGAEFVVSPHTDPEVIETCNRRGVLSMAGVMTPTEAVTALEAGADVLKVFPASTVGPSHLSALAGPLGPVDLVPTGGVTLENVRDFVDAGAIAVGIGGALVDGEAIRRGAYDELESRAADFVDAIEEAREE
ncbi:bifunctional 4-hydroxy-2-oxoglutarate aldolase/2-dehydro-3-deoxy-phosphogluconate aldolase [Halovivax sp.]|uniref:bifunctional 4-hydroxy-2-oxoglutarate aldolase/2-dehydro-3-deoxy-phosphogluconate aldolase n=1 Tax=Halovivax sp. TaxID=1935978 RepID=UPI0025C270D1|nr:bifunctional 4-hydroxy-2-oxoglutarate aldolase/2-dehydro-3-deoxy-phosphogluconate aldolase [Halovivax sp.]